MLTLVASSWMPDRHALPSRSQDPAARAQHPGEIGAPQVMAEEVRTAPLLAHGKCGSYDQRNNQQPASQSPLRLPERKIQRYQRESRTRVSPGEAGAARKPGRSRAIYTRVWLVAAE